MAATAPIVLVAFLLVGFVGAIAGYFAAEIAYKRRLTNGLRLLALLFGGAAPSWISLRWGLAARSTGSGASNFFIGLLGVVFEGCLGGLLVGIFLPILVSRKEGRKPA